MNKYAFIMTKTFSWPLISGIALLLFIVPLVTSAAYCPSLYRNLGNGMSGEDVRQLQVFLNQDPTTRVAVTGAGSPGQETTYYGSLTEQAVRRFQCKHNIVCSGSSETTGWGAVGPQTRSRIAQICVGGSGGGGLQRMLLALSPSSGGAPLTVNATITLPQPNITPVEICGPIIIGTISWGDGTVDTRPTRLGCSGQYVVTTAHTYTTQGTYHVQLTDISSVQQAVQTVLVSSASSGTTFNATPTTGKSPKEVEFFGRTITSYPGGVRIEYGDGQAEQFCTSGVACTNTIKHTYSSVGKYTAQLIGVQPSGNVVLGSVIITIEEPGIPSVTVSLSETVTGAGKTVTVSWNSENAPDNSKVRLEVWESGASPTLGNNDNGIAVPQSTAGSISWKVPNESPCSADSGLLSCIKVGAYKVVAKLYTGGDCWGYCISGTERTVHAIGTSLGFTVSDTAVPGSFAIGDRVKTTSALNVRETASINGTLRGVQPKGAEGTVKEGPKSASGFVWWKIDWDTGADGWSVQDFLEKVVEDPNEFSATPKSGGAPLTVTFSGTVYSDGYSIDFGDGTTSGAIGCAHGACSNTGPTSVNIVHTYSATSTYIAKLRRHYLSNEANCAGDDCNVIGTIVITVGSTSGTCMAPTGDLSLADTDADTNDEVSLLQEFLAKDSAIYPEGLITGFFGHLTEAAVKRYQKSKGILQTGFVGPLTRAAIRIDCGQDPEPEETPSKYSFKADPTSGDAPLLVTFTALAAETKEESVWYSVDFGNGKQGNMSADTTDKTKLSVSHTYEKGGTFIAKLIQNEDLCGNEGTVVFGCTKQLIIDTATVTISGGTAGGTGGSVGTGGCAEPQLWGDWTFSQTCGAVPFTFTITVKDGVMRGGSWMFGISVPGAGRVFTVEQKITDKVSIGDCWYMTNSPGFISASVPDKKTCTLTLHEAGTYPLTLFNCSGSQTLDRCDGPVQMGGIRITGTK